MIIIDQDAENKLTKALEELRAAPGATRCIYLALANKHIDHELVMKTLPAFADLSIDSLNKQLFLCEDGDVFILAPIIQTKEAFSLASNLGAVLGLPIGDDWFNLFELSIHINKPLLILEHKIDRKRMEEAAEKKREQEKIAARKRQSILAVSVKQDTAERISILRAARQNREVMLIEDDAFSRRLVENVLGKSYSVTGLGDAETALATYIRLAPDILFLDINLPDVTGHELLEKIMKIDPNAYVVMLSGNADRENITQAMARGAKGFVAKPFTREKLFEYVERCPTFA